MSQADSTQTKLAKCEIHREIRYIIERAQAGDSRIVTLGNIVLFSTTTGDAWLLDADDSLALCVCHAGTPQPIRVVETESTFAIEWPARFTIENGAFLAEVQDGREVAMDGYPVAEILAACRR